ncbi:MAG: hypothetical protein ACYTG2_01910 [Planctomycetota bacterium]|jgi:hypothetical protein
MILRKLILPACFVAVLTIGCGTPSTKVAADESVGFDANAKPACCAEKTECSEAKKAECEAKKSECSEAEKAECEASGGKTEG